MVFFIIIFSQSEMNKVYTNEAHVKWTAVSNTRVHVKPLRSKHHEVIVIGEVQNIREQKHGMRGNNEVKLSDMKYDYSNEWSAQHWEVVLVWYRSHDRVAKWSRLVIWSAQMFSCVWANLLSPFCKPEPVLANIQSMFERSPFDFASVFTQLYLNFSPRKLSNPDPSDQ